MKNLYFEDKHNEKVSFVWIVKNKNRPLKETVKGNIDVYSDHLVTDCNSSRRDYRLCKRLVKLFGMKLSISKQPASQSSPGWAG